MNKKTLAFLGMALGTIALDQITKQLVFRHIGFQSDEIYLVPGFLSLIHVQNPGSAFSMLRDFPYRIYVFLGFAAIAAGIVIDLWRRLPRNDVFNSVTLGLILAGTSGNAIDRIINHGEVIDFIRVYTENPGLKSWLISTFGTAEWPTFNVADSALVVGVGLFLVHYLFLEDRGEEASTPDPAPSPPPAGSGAP